MNGEEFWNALKTIEQGRSVQLFFDNPEDLCSWVRESSGINSRAIINGVWSSVAYAGVYPYVVLEGFSVDTSEHPLRLFNGRHLVEVKVLPRQKDTVKYELDTAKTLV